MDLGYHFGQKLSRGSIVCLFGELGAGKTTFVKGLASGAAGTNPVQICSPTFVYLNIYQGRQTIYHFDLYRLKNEQDFVLLGFEEFLYGDGISVIEWPERISSILSKNTQLIELSYLPQGREALVGSWGDHEV